MRLLIDATTAQHARGGIGVVAAGLIGALQGRTDVQATVIAGPATDTGILSRWQPPLVARTAPRIVFQRLALPGVVALAAGRLGEPERLLLLDSYVPQWRWPGNGPRIETFVHDVLPLTHPGFFPRRKDAAKRIALRAIRSQRPMTFTSSDFTANDISKVLGVEALVARFGCGQFSDDEAQDLLSRPRRPAGDHLVYVGAIEARKDIRTLVEGFLTSRSARCLRLAFVGDWQTPEGRALQAWSKATAGDSVRFLGRRASRETREIVEGARALIYPSLAEGFGLPVLEGMAAKVPVIATSIPAIQSWAGEGARYFTAGDPASLADAIDEVLLGDTRALVARGQQVSEGYRWARFAETILAA